MENYQKNSYAILIKEFDMQEFEKNISNLTKTGKVLDIKFSTSLIKLADIDRQCYTALVIMKEDIFE